VSLFFCLKLSLVFFYVFVFILLNGKKQIIMQSKFFIDRQFGHPIWIEVIDGMITQFPHEGKMEDVLNERYKGTPITQFKEEFEKAMAPSFHCVKCEDIVTKQLAKNSLEVRISHLWNQKSSIKTPPKQKEVIAKMIEDLEGQLYEHDAELSAIKNVVKEVHNFPIE
jgi:hypothetical protein